MTTFTYKLDHDLGFAPNPFFEYCTLACCKPKVRNAAKAGDLIVGLAGKSGGIKAHYPRVIYWMQVSEIIDFDAYWYDPRFKLKRPIMSGPKIFKVGDNTYRKCDDSGEWLQEISMHNIPGTPIKKTPHIQRDTSINKVLVGNNFTYWGGTGPVLPDELLGMFKNRDFQRNHPSEHEKKLHTLLSVNTPLGYVSEPIDWGQDKYFVRA